MRTHEMDVGGRRQLCMCLFCRRAMHDEMSGGGGADCDRRHDGLANGDTALVGSADGAIAPVARASAPRRIRRTPPMARAEHVSFQSLVRCQAATAHLAPCRRGRQRASLEALASLCAPPCVHACLFTPLRSDVVPLAALVGGVGGVGGAVAHASAPRRICRTTPMGWAEHVNFEIFVRVQSATAHLAPNPGGRQRASLEALAPLFFPACVCPCDTACSPTPLRIGVPRFSACRHRHSAWGFRPPRSQRRVAWFSVAECAFGSDPVPRGPRMLSRQPARVVTGARGVVVAWPELPV